MVGKNDFPLLDTQVPYFPQPDSIPCFSLDSYKVLSLLINSLPTLKGHSHFPEIYPSLPSWKH